MSDDRPYTLTLPNGREVRTRLEWEQHGEQLWHPWGQVSLRGSMLAFVAAEEVPASTLIDLADDLREIRSALGGEE